MLTQDTFNKIVTGSLLLYFMIMFFVSWILNKPLNLENFITFIGPLVSQIVHLSWNIVTNNTAVNAANKTDASKIAATKQILSNASNALPTVSTNGNGSHDQKD